MNIANRLRELRESKGLSQYDIERRSGLLRSYVSRVEGGHTRPSLKTLEKFAAALEIEPYQFFSEKADGTNGPKQSDKKGMSAPALRLLRLYENMSDTNRQLLMTLAVKMAKIEGRPRNRDFFAHASLAGKTSGSAPVGAVTNDSVRARLDDSAVQEDRRSRLLAFLKRPTPAWDPADHPDIDEAGGAAAWVKRLRHETERAFKKRTGARKR